MASVMVGRLQTRAQFQAVLAAAVLTRTAHFSLHRCALSQNNAGLPLRPALCLGALIPKRWAKRATTRNLIRRQIYTVAAAHSDRLAQTAHVVRLRVAFDPRFFVSASSAALKSVVRAELQQLFLRAAQPSEAQGMSA